MSAPLDPEIVGRIGELVEQGVSRAQIAARLRIAPSTVSKYAPAGAFDRAATRTATKARAADARALRVQLAHDLLRDAARLRASMWQPHTAFAFGGKENTYNEHKIPEPTAGDKRALMAAAATAIDRSIRLLDYDSGENPEAGRSLIEDFMDAVAARAADINDQP